MCGRHLEAFSASFSRTSSCEFSLRPLSRASAARPKASKPAPSEYLLRVLTSSTSTIKSLPESWGLEFERPVRAPSSSAYLERDPFEQLSDPPDDCSCPKRVSIKSSVSVKRWLQTFIVDDVALEIALDAPDTVGRARSGRARPDLSIQPSRDQQFGLQRTFRKTF